MAIQRFSFASISESQRLTNRLKALTFKPDIILIDLMMKELSGWMDDNVVVDVFLSSDKSELILIFERHHSFWNSSFSSEKRLGMAEFWVTDNASLSIFLFYLENLPLILWRQRNLPLD